MRERIALSGEQLAAFCRKWKITELAWFGSVLRGDFRADSDIDVLVTFAPDAHWGWRIVDCIEELEALLGRPVDLVTRWSVEHSANPLRRDAILSSAEVVYAAA